MHQTHDILKFIMLLILETHLQPFYFKRNDRISQKSLLFEQNV